MCGFGGVISSDKKITKHKLEKVASCVSFRGPDNTGVNIYDSIFNPAETEGCVGLFFNRLAIIDLDKRSNQPFEDEQYVLVFNGEIYNYVTLRDELIKLGVIFKTSSDTEVLFHLLVKYGKDCLEKLNGMFAFVFIDKSKRTLLMARDRTGIKPLNYLIDETGFYFASESDSIIRLKENRLPFAINAIRSYLTFQYIPTPFTAWEGIYKLPPGSYIQHEFADLEHQKNLGPVTYWDPYEQLNEVQGGSAQLEDLLSLGLGSQLVSDVPLGLFLSSGIDSSLLAGLINKYYSNGTQYNFFTVAFSEELKEVNEAEDAKTFLEGFKNKNFYHHVLQVDSSFVRDEIRTMYQFLDEPFGDYAFMLNLAISKKANKLVTVALSGDGSDELFWGYPRYNSWLKQRKSNWFFKKMFGLKDPLDSYLKMIASDYFFSTYNIQHNVHWWEKNIELVQHRKDLPSLIDMKTYLNDCMFYKVDRSSMGASLEVRVPFMDNSVIDHALKMKLDQKRTGTYPTKSILREILSEVAPHYNKRLPKRGFSLPLKQWLNKDWKSLVMSEMVSANLQKFELQDDFNHLLDRHYNKGMDQSIEIWRLLNLALWYESKKTLLN